MKARAFARGDDEGGGASALGLWDFNVAIGLKGHSNTVYRGERFCGLAFEIAAGDGDAQACDALIEMRSDRLHGAIGADRIVRVKTLHGVVGKREIACAARERPEMIQACHKRKTARAAEPAISRFQPKRAAE